MKLRCFEMTLRAEKVNASLFSWNSSFSIYHFSVLFCF